MKIININHRNNFHQVLIDDEDFAWIKSCLVSIEKIGESFYVQIYRRDFGSELLHRKIMSIYDNIEGVEIDHKDRNPLNNQKSNLRIATHQQNSINAGPQSNNTSGYKGVWCMRDKYQASIIFSNKKIHLGTFDNPRDAAIAYDLKAQELFGEFAFLNFPDQSVIKNDIEKVLQRIKKIKRLSRTSKFRGVAKGWQGKWTAQICFKGKSIYLGSFDLEIEAAQAYNKKAIEIHGTKAKINII